MQYIMSLDQGTTSSRCILFDKGGRICASVQKEFTEIWIKTSVFESFVTLKMGTWTSWWQRTLRHVVWIFQV